MFEKIRALLCEQLDCKPEDITMDTDIIEDLGADSLEVIDMVMSMEDEFGLEIPDEDVESLRTIGSVVKYLEDHME